MNYSRRDFVKKLGCAALSAGMFSVSGCSDSLSYRSGNDKKLNVVLILVDDMGWTDLACYGSKYYETPNIDALADKGIKFTNAYSAAAVCSPTRASILTGRSPVRTGVTDWIRPLYDPYKLEESNEVNNKLWPETEYTFKQPPAMMELNETTIAEKLKPYGYKTASIGKWHLGPKGNWPEDQGFDTNIAGCHLGYPPTYFDPYYHPNRFGVDEFYAEDVTMIANIQPRKQGEFLTDRIADEVSKFIRRSKANPFFVYMPFYAVHTPVEAKTELIAKYEKKPKTNQKSPVYAALVETVDNAVGQIVKTLNEEGLSDNTLVIFTSDNGGRLHGENGTDNKPLRAGKAYQYEGGIRVPAIISCPSLAIEVKESHVPVTSVDFFPTICDALGIKYDKQELDGKSLLPLLKGKSIDRDALYWHYPHYLPGLDVVPYSIIRKGNWKYIKYYDDKSPELFDLENDISEKNDLYLSRRDKAQELSKRLDKWLKDNKAFIPVKKIKTPETAG